MNEKHEDNLDRVWDIIEKVGVTMLTTQFSAGLRARPVEARPKRDAGLIWFVTDVRSGKEHEIEAEHDVGLVFIDGEAKAYLSITARAEVRHDHAKAAEILEAHRQHVVERTGRSECLRAEGATGHRRALGRAGECRGGRFRIRQGADHRRKAQSRREPQGHREDVTSIAPASARCRVWSA